MEKRINLKICKIKLKNQRIPVLTINDVYLYSIKLITIRTIKQNKKWLWKTRRRFLSFHYSFFPIKPMFTVRNRRSLEKIKQIKLKKRKKRNGEAKISHSFSVIFHCHGDTQNTSLLSLWIFIQFTELQFDHGRITWKPRSPNEAPILIVINPGTHLNP